MAFHPFGIVRKYQKVLMALATVFCMGVFILQFGRGDLIESLLGRGGQNKGEKLITLYGKDVYPSDVTRDRQGRQIANQLVQAAVGSAGGDANKNVMAYNPDKPNADDDQLKQLRGALTSRSQFIYQLLQVRPNRQIQEFLGSIAGQVEHDVATLDALQISIGSSDQPDKAKAAEQTRMIKDLRLLFKLQYLLASGPGALYFGGGVKDEDILDFEVWKHQAEKLGVVLTKADARRLIAHEAGDRGLPADPGGSWASDPLIKTFLDDPHTQMTEDQLVTAVVDEFRVEIAQNLLAGRASGVPALGIPDLTTDPYTPYDFWTYFRDNRTTLKVAFLPIPVPSFTDRVPGAPDLDELGKLFNQYRSNWPRPEQPDAGLQGTAADSDQVSHRPNGLGLLQGTDRPPAIQPGAAVLLRRPARQYGRRRRGPRAVAGRRADRRRRPGRRRRWRRTMEKRRPTAAPVQPGSAIWSDWDWPARPRGRPGRSSPRPPPTTASRRRSG